MLFMYVKVFFYIIKKIFGLQQLFKTSKAQINLIFKNCHSMEYLGSQISTLLKKVVFCTNL